MQLNLKFEWVMTALMFTWDNHIVASPVHNMEKVLVLTLEMSLNS